MSRPTIPRGQTPEAPKQAPPPKQETAKQAADDDNFDLFGSEDEASENMVCVCVCVHTCLCVCVHACVHKVFGFRRKLQQLRSSGRNVWMIMRRRRQQVGDPFVQPWLVQGPGSY